jgi:hypothetical protein
MVRSSPGKSSPARPVAPSYSLPSGGHPVQQGAKAPTTYIKPPQPAASARPKAAPVEVSSSTLKAQGSKKEIVVTTPSYPAKILMNGDFSSGGTIVLTKGAGN